jgi:hypothetical protein
VTETVEDYLATIDELARTLIAGNQRVYLVGTEILRVALSEDFPDIGVALHLIWLELTNRVDAPNRPPGAEEAASAEMIRAATEWLEVSHDAARRAAYLERWIYGELGMSGPIVIAGRPWRP